MLIVEVVVVIEVETETVVDVQLFQSDLVAIRNLDRVMKVILDYRKRSRRT